jgi:hypothetical protein
MKIEQINVPAAEDAVILCEGIVVPIVRPPFPDPTAVKYIPILLVNGLCLRIRSGVFPSQDVN